MSSATTRQFGETEKKHFEELKSKVKLYANSAREWAVALLEIQTHEYWRIEGSVSFHAWCIEHTPWAYKTVQNVISDVTQANHLKLIEETTGEAPEPTAPPPRKRKPAPAPSNNGHVTEPQLSAARSSPVASLEQPGAVYDTTGYPIPETLHALWARRNEVNEIMSQISYVKCALQDIQDVKDELWKGCNFSGAIADLEKSYAAVGAAKPHAVCTACQGRVTAKCSFCGGKGFINKLQFDVQVPKELKTIREKACVK